MVFVSYNSSHESLVGPNNMNFSEAVWCAARQHVLLFSCFIALSAVLAVLQAWFGKEEGRWMALMSGVWTIINAGIAVWLFSHIHLPGPEILPHVFSHIMAYMRLNVAADIAYAAAGTVLLGRRGRHRVMLRGFGKAVLIQAAVLTLLDLLFLARVVALHKVFLAG